MKEPELAHSGEPLRVLHVITRLIIGGAQENTLLSAEGLGQMPEFDVTLVTGVDDGPEGDLLDRARSTTRLIVIPTLARSINPLNDLRALGALYRVMRSGHYDIVHTHSSKAGILGRVAARMARVPIVVHTLHSLVFHDYQPRLVNRLWWIMKRSCAPITDHYVSVADAISRMAIEEKIAPPERFSTIYSGMELDWFLDGGDQGPQTRHELGIPEDATVVGKIARLFPLKGHEQLMDAAPAIVAEHPKVRFLLVGDGILRDYVLGRARQMGIEENFVLTGLVPPDQIPKMISAMDLVVHTSLREGLARVLPQALAMGKPCVSVDLDGAPEVVIDGETGFLVPPKDPVALETAVCKLIADPQLRARMGAEGRSVVNPRFRAETMCKELADLYTVLAREKMLRPAEFNDNSEHNAAPFSRGAT